MRVGDMVRLKSMGRPRTVCFVEAVVSERAGSQQVSLYALDGEYIGDWWTDEIVALEGRVAGQQVHDLMLRHADNLGFVEDMERVLVKLADTETVCVEVEK